MLRRVENSPCLNRANRGYRTSKRVCRFHKLDHSIDKTLKRHRESDDFVSNRLWFSRIRWEEHGVNNERHHWSDYVDWLTGYFWKIYGSEHEE